MTVAWAGARGRHQVPFRRLYSPLKRPVPADAEIVTAYTDGQVTLRSRRDKIGYHEAADLSGYQGVEPGDLVVHGLDILRGSVGVSDALGAMSSVCTVCAPSSLADGRFVAFAIRAQAQSGYTRALARGIREGGADFRRWDTLGELPIPLPPVEEQRRIADFLDDQVTRIDNIIAARRRQIDCVLSLLSSMANEVLAGAELDGPPLSAVSQIVDTEHKTAPDVADGGHWIAGTSAIRAGRIVVAELRETDAVSFAEWTKRAAPTAGDVLLTREAPVGEVGLLEDGHAPIAVGQRVVLVRPGPNLNPLFLRLVLMSPVSLRASLA